MPFTHDEEKRLQKMESQLSSMYNVIVGDDRMDKRPGFAERMIHVEETIEDLKDKIDEHTRLIMSVKRSWKQLLIALLIGFIVGGIIFGLFTLKDAKNAIDIMK